MTTRSLSVLAFLGLALVPGSLKAQLKVNEVSTALPSWIEIVNLGPAPVSVAGYKIRFGGNSGLSFVQGVFTIPAGVTLNPNQALVITEDISIAQPVVPVGVFKAYCGSTIVWAATPTVGANGAVALNDPGDVGIDRMKWGNPLQDFSSYGSPFTGSISPAANVMYRSAPIDTDTTADWGSSTVAGATPGAINPGEANVIDLEFTTIAGGGLTVEVFTYGPAVAGGEIFNLISLIDSNPDGSGPLFGVGADALLQATTPVGPGNPFHTNLDGTGHWIISVPSGSLPIGLHIEGVSLLYNGTIARISTVEVTTIL
jgi:hypothetical protein